MKKILAFILTLAMVLSLFSVGFVVSATTTYETAPDTAKAVTTVAELEAMSSGGVYKLTGTIEIATSDIATATDLVTIPAGVTLYGQGNKIIYKGAAADYVGSMFAFGEGSATTTIKDVFIGTSDNKINAAQERVTTNDCASIFANDTADTKVVWENCSFYINATAGTGNYGAYMFTMMGAHTFDGCTIHSVQTKANQSSNWIRMMYGNAASLTMNDCTVSGSGTGSNIAGLIFSSAGTVNLTDVVLDVELTSPSNYNMAGFIYSQNGTANLTRCSTAETMEIRNTAETITGNAGGFVSHLNGTVVFDDCVNNADVTVGLNAGGFVHQNNGNGTYKNCVNNGTITGTQENALAGGIIARANATSSVINMQNCVNNGAVITSAAKTTNYGVGGLAGHVGATTTFSFVNCTNYGEVQGHGNIGGIVGRIDHAEKGATFTNCVNYGKLSNPNDAKDVGGIVGQTNAVGKVTFENCVNYGTISSTVGQGGILGSIYNQDRTVDIIGCKNYGTINTSAVSGGLFGCIAGNYSGNTVNITNSANYGSVYATTYSGGLVATTGTVAAAGNVANTSINITNSANYGYITSGHTVAGFIAQVHDGATVTIDKCLNAGMIGPDGGASNNEGVGGFIGRISLEANTTAKVSISNSANIGTINGGYKTAPSNNNTFGDTFGQFIGMYGPSPIKHFYEENNRVGGFVDWANATNTPALTNCYAYGVANVATKGTPLSMTGWYTADESNANYTNTYATTTVAAGYTISAIAATATDTLNGVSYYKATYIKASETDKTYYVTTTDKDAVTAVYDQTPAGSYYQKSTIVVTEAPKGGVCGINVEYTGTVNLLDANTTAAQAAATLKTLLGIDLIAGNTSKGENAVVAPTPAIKGYQHSTDNKDLRVLATIDTVAYDAVNFTYSVKWNGDDVTSALGGGVANVETVYNSINANTEGSITAHTAASMGAKYICAVEFQNITSVSGTLEIIVTATAQKGEGTYSSQTYVFTYVDGVFQGVVAQ